MRISAKTASALLAIALSICFTSCNRNGLSDSDVLKEVVREDNLISISEKVAKDQYITAEEIDLFTAAVNRLSDTKDSLIGKSVEQLIEGQKDFKKVQSLSSMQTSLAKAQMFMAHKLTFAGIMTDDKQPDQKLDFIVYDVQNTTKKEIADVQGTLQFYNKMNQIIKIYPLLSKQVMGGKTIKPGETMRVAFPFFHSDTNARDQAMRSNDPKIAVWQPTMIQFKDSSKFSMPANEQKPAAKK